MWFDGRRLDRLGDNARTRLRRTEFGFLFQFGQLVPELTAEENVALPLLLGGTKRGPALEQARLSYAHFQEQIQQCQERIEQQMRSMQGHLLAKSQVEGSPEVTAERAGSSVRLNTGGQSADAGNELVPGDDDRGSRRS